MSHVPGWASRCTLHYDIRLRGTSKDGRPVTSTGYSGGYPIPEAFMNPPMLRDSWDQNLMQQWAVFIFV